VSDLSARALLECFHRYLDSEARSLEEIAPGVYQFCGAQARVGSSIIDVACGTFRHDGPGSEYEIVSGRLLSVDDDVVDVHDDADRRVVELADGTVIALPGSPTRERLVDADRRFELCVTQLEPCEVSS
jgi:hypothetical protein